MIGGPKTESDPVADRAGKGNARGERCSSITNFAMREQPNVVGLCPEGLSGFHNPAGRWALLFAFEYQRLRR